MTLDPLHSGSRGQSEAARLPGAGSSRRPEAAAPCVTAVDSAAGPGDSVEVSSASRSLADAGTVPTGTITAERLREIARRMEQDRYDTADVRDTVARRALRDLGTLGTE